MSNSVVRAVKQSLADQLTAQAYFANIPVFVIIPKDIYSQIEQGVLPVEAGIAVFIEAFRASNVNPNTPGPYYDAGNLTISVVEQPTLNTSNPDCDEVSETAQRILQLFFTMNGREACYVTNPTEVENKKFSVRRFQVITPIGFQPYIFPAMPGVVITPNGGEALDYPLTATLSVAIPGAAIFYTLDGSFPTPLNPSAQLYGPEVLTTESGVDLTTEAGVPLTTDFSGIQIAGPGTVLSARAYLAGYQSPAPSQALFN